MHIIVTVLLIGAVSAQQAIDTGSSNTSFTILIEGIHSGGHSGGSEAIVQLQIALKKAAAGTSIRVYVTANYYNEYFHRFYGELLGVALKLCETFRLTNTRGKSRARYFPTFFVSRGRYLHPSRGTLYE